MGLLLLLPLAGCAARALDPEDAERVLPSVRNSPDCAREDEKRPLEPLGDTDPMTEGFGDPVSLIKVIGDVVRVVV